MRGRYDEGRTLSRIVGQRVVDAPRARAGTATAGALQCLAGDLLSAMGTLTEAIALGHVR
jgi:hypothetical protein